MTKQLAGEICLPWLDLDVALFVHFAKAGGFLWSIADWLNQEAPHYRLSRQILALTTNSAILLAFVQSTTFNFIFPLPTLQDIVSLMSFIPQIMSLNSKREALLFAT